MAFDFVSFICLEERRKKKKSGAWVWGFGREDDDIDG